MNNSTLLFADWVDIYKFEIVAQSSGSITISSKKGLVVGKSLLRQLGADAFPTPYFSFTTLISNMYGTLVQSLHFGTDTTGVGMMLENNARNRLHCRSKGNIIK